MAELSHEEVAANIKAKLDFECDCKIQEHIKSGGLYVVAEFDHSGKQAFVAASLNNDVIEALQTEWPESDGVAEFLAKMLTGKREDFMRDNP